ncbi:MAG: hypothetical protein WBD87_11965 [Candidatus Acidiferrales bacterium]
MVISQPSPDNIIISVNFVGGSITDAGNGNSELTCSGAESPGVFITGVGLFGTYLENHYAASDAMDFQNCGFTLSNVVVGGIGGTNVVKISQMTGDAIPSIILGLQDASIGRFMHTINNTVTGFVYSAPGGSLPFYTFAQPGYIGSQAIFDNMDISTGSSCTSSSSPANCGSAAAGSFVIPAGSTSVVVDTAVVTANSQILVTFDSSLGAKLGVTCNTTYAAPWVSQRTPGASFTVSAATTPQTNPACYSYAVIN